MLIGTSEVSPPHPKQVSQDPSLQLIQASLEFSKNCGSNRQHSKHSDSDRQGRADKYRGLNQSLSMQCH